MVSLWPWRGEDASPAGFEKTLSTISKKIAETQQQLDKVRSNSRRVKLLLTLYLSFAYLVYAIVLILVIGWQNLGAWEWGGLGGGPVVLYVTRTLTNAYFTMRIESLEARLKVQQTERAKTIQKLKDATKFDSTQELLEKYGGEKSEKKAAKENDGSTEQHKNSKDAGRNGVSHAHGQPTPRTTMPPPPTANIARPPTLNTSPSHPRPQDALLAQSPQTKSPGRYDNNADFAPNADDLPASYAQYDNDGGAPHWYDRILDLMLGEDETAPKNRIVLICKECRLVNGQAPPGTKDLAELGQWKCMSCGALNGEVDEGKKIVREVLQQHGKPSGDQVDDMHPSGRDKASTTDRGGQNKAETSALEEAGTRRRAGKAVEI